MKEMCSFHKKGSGKNLSSIKFELALNLAILGNIKNTNIVIADHGESHTQAGQLRELFGKI